MKTIILTYATPSEKPDVAELKKELLSKNIILEPLCTGVGKINAYSSLLEAITHQTVAVINVGTCGSATEKIGTVLLCGVFTDLDLIEHTSADTVFFSNNSNCYTSDRFVTSSDIRFQACDMEAYPQALLCKNRGLKFISIKCVTDIVGNNDREVYESNKADAVSNLSKYLTISSVLKILDL